MRNSISQKRGSGKRPVCSLLIALCVLQVVVASVANGAARGRPYLNAARTTFVADNGELLRGPFTSTEWTSAVPESEIANMKNLGFNAVHLYAEVFDPNYPSAGSTAPGYNVTEVDKIVQYTRNAGMYLVMTIGNGANNGNHNAQWAHDFWNFYAGRYKDETHVIYEIHNEPLAWGPSYLTGTTPPNTLDMEIDCYNTIRAAAPDTPVLLFSYAVLGDTGGANAALTDIHYFNQQVFGSQDVVWTNEAVGFHGYAGASANAIAVDQLISAGYPCFMTEFATGTWGGEHGGLDVEAVANLERLGVSWLTFQFIPPWGVSDDITRPDAYVERVEKSGLSWTPDYGTWPVARSVFGNGGYPWTTPGYVINTLSGSLRIQAENFDNGGEGVAYHDLDAANGGGQYRTGEGVDIETTSDAGGGYDVSSIETGEWLEYTAKVSAAGMYNLRLRVAGTSGGRLQVLAYGEDITGDWTLPGTAGAQSWTTVTKSVFLRPGQQILRVNVLEGGFNLNWLELSVQSSGPIANGTYKLLNAATSQAMDIDVNNNVVVSDYTGAADEQWSLQHIGGGQYRITSVGDGNSWTTFSGPLHIGPWWGASGDRCFIFRPTGDGFYQVFSAGGGKCFQPSLSDAPLLDDVVYTGAAVQKWAVVSPSAPAFPSGVSAVLAGWDTAEIRWEAVSGATSYMVKRSTTSGGPYTTIATGVASTSYIDSGLSAGVQYYYVVSAVAGGSESLDSTEAVLGYPELTGSVIGTDGSWNSSGDTIDKVFDGDFSTFFDAPIGNGAWVGLDFGAGESNIITQINYCPRSGFGDRMVGGIFQGANQASFIDAVTLYTIVSQPASGGFTSVEIDNPGTFRFVRYRSPNGGYGNVAELEFYGYSTIPVEPVPTGLSAVAVPGGRIELNWNGLTNAASYNVKRSTVGDGPYTTIASNVVDTTYSDTGLSGGTTYYYVVSAETASGESGDSAPASATPTAPYDGGPWTVPGRIEAENYDYGGQGIAYNDSTAGNSGGGYRSGDVDVEVCSDTGGGYNIGYTTAGEWLQFTIDVDATGIYDITVRAASQWAQISSHVEVDGVDVTGSMTASSTGAWQTYTDVTAADIALTAGQHVMRLYFDAPDFNVNYIDVSAVALMPDAPGNLGAVAVSDTRIDLSWTSSAYADSYTVKRSTVSGAPYDILASNVVSSTYIDTAGLNAGTRYYYVVSAVNAVGEGGHSDETSAVPSVLIAPEEYVIADHAITGGTNLSMTVSNSVPGHDYQIWASDDLVAPDWQPVDAGQAGTGSNLEFNIPVDGSSTNRYFKLEVERQ